MKSYYILAVLAIFVNPIIAHNDETIFKRDSNGIIKYVKYASTDANAPKTSEEFFTNVMGINKSDYFVLDRSKKAQNNMTFERYQQYYQGVFVDGGHYNFRIQNNRVKAVTGHLVDVKLVNPIPLISEKGAIESYISLLKLKRDEIIYSSAKLIIKEIHYESAESSNIPKLVYVVNITTTLPKCPDIGYIDAQTGNLLYTQKSTFDYSANGKFYTYYNRNNNDTPKNAKTEYKYGHYILEDNTRGHIRTHKYDYSDFIDSDNIWTREEMGDFNIALDVHWTFQQIYDVLYDDFNYESYDDNNGDIRSIIRGGDDAKFHIADNTFTFGTGTYGNRPFGTVDVVSHEFGHAILYHTTGWNPQTDEEYALHEGFADIWGVLFESYITPNADIWRMGQDLFASTYSCVRNIADPGDLTAMDQIADTYGTGLWYHEDAHVRSGVCSHWFYLLAQGGSGVNGLGHHYVVLPVGLELAEQLFAFTVLNTAYLEDCTSLVDVKDAFYDAAYDMGDPFLADQVENAWYAVGVGNYQNSISGPNQVCGHGLYQVYHLPNNYSVQWSFTNAGNYPAPTLQSNSSTNSCMVYANSVVNGTLIATIWDNALALGTYTKQISGDTDSFIAYYWVGNNYFDVLSEDDNWASPGDVIYIQSSNFAGKTFKLSRSSSPNSFTTLTLNGSQLQFVMPNLANGESLILWVIGSCDTYAFNFYSNSTRMRSNRLQIVGLGESQYLICLNQENDTNGSLSEIKAEKNKNDNTNWELQVFKASDQQLITTQYIKGNSCILETSSWSSGVYIVRAIEREKTYAIKMTIK